MTEITIMQSLKHDEISESMAVATASATNLDDTDSSDIAKIESDRHDVVLESVATDVVSMPTHQDSSDTAKMDSSSHDLVSESIAADTDLANTIKVENYSHDAISVAIDKVSVPALEETDSSVIVKIESDRHDVVSESMASSSTLEDIDSVSVPEHTDDSMITQRESGSLSKTISVKIESNRHDVVSELMATNVDSSSTLDSTGPVSLPEHTDDNKSQGENGSLSETISANQATSAGGILRTILESTSRRRRRRKQQKPQRCDRSHHVLPPVSYDEPGCPEDIDVVAEGSIDRDPSFEINAIEYSESESSQTSMQSDSLDNFTEKSQIRQSGFHLKLLHRPYFMKGNNKRSLRFQPHKCAECGDKFPLKTTLRKHISLKHTVKIHQCSFCGKQYRLANSLKQHIKRDHSGDTHHCVKCDKFFSSKDSLRQHRRVHSGKKPHACHQCGNRCRTLQNLKDHMESHSGVILNCEICGKQYNRHASLRKHVRTDHSDETHQCVRCDKYFTTEYGLKKHFTIHTGEKPYSCDHCGVKFRLPHHLKAHVNLHNGIILSCEICGKNYNMRDSLMKHMERSHSGETHPCDKCDKYFKTKDGLKKHLNIHTGEKPYSCDHCGMKFRLSHHLKGHMQLHSGIVLSCEICGKHYSMRASLVKHMKTSHSGKSYRCEKCKKLFSSMESLKSHRAVHSEERPYKCDHCGMKFRRRHHLKAHMQLHDGVVLSCDICDKQYNRYDSLKKHIKYDHSGETHQCVKCFKCFASKDSLKQHSRIHTGEKPYSCNQCGMQFRYRHHLTQHVELHTGVVFICESCGKQYNRRDSLRRHVKYCHQRDINIPNGDFVQDDLANTPGHDSISDLLHNSTNTIGDQEFGTALNEIDQVSFSLQFCRQCDVTFTDRQALLKHMQVKHRKVILVCPICNMQYHIRDSLRKHVKSAHKMKLKDNRSTKAETIFRQLTCPDPNIEIADVEIDDDIVPTKVQLSGGESPSQMSPDGENGGNQEGATSHPLEVLSGKQYNQMAKMYPQIAKLTKCPFCDKYYRLKNSLRNHIKKVHFKDNKNSLSGLKDKGTTSSLSKAPSEPAYDVKPNLPYVGEGDEIDDMEDLANIGDEKTDNLQRNEGETTQAKERDSDLSSRTDVFKTNIDDTDDSNNQSELSTPGAQEGFADGANLKQLASEDNGDVKAKDHDSRNRPMLPDATAQGGYVCDICSFRFSNQADLEIHLQTHPGCPLCLKQYVFKDSLRKHIKRSHPEYFQKTLDSKKKSNLEKAIKLAAKDSAFTPTKQGDDVVMDMGDTSTNESKVIQCATCHLCFMSQAELDIHVVIHPKCPCCTKRYTLRDSLRKHIKRSHPSLHWEMAEERKSSKRNHPFYAESNQEDSSGSRQVGESGAMVEGALGAHQSSNSPDDSANYSDDINEKPDILSNNNVQFTCYNCPTQFSSNEDLSKHVQNRPTCPYCSNSKQYCTRDSLRNHIRRSHKDQRDADGAIQTRIMIENKFTVYELVCSACNQSFDNWQNLQDHEAIHPKCEYCGKLYVLRSSLRKHRWRKHKSGPSVVRNEGVMIKLIEGSQDVVFCNSKDNADTSFNDSEMCQSTLSQQEVQQSSVINTTESELVEEHLTSNHGNHEQRGGVARDVFPCSACLIIFDNQEALDFHVQTHLACQFCGRLYTLQDSLRRHIKRSHPDKCYMQSPQSQVQLFKPSHEDESEEDDGLQVGFSTNESGNGHLKADYEQGNDQTNDSINEEVKNLCPVCFLVFDNDEAYDAHTKSHPKCQECGKMYRLKDSLKKHMQRSHPTAYAEMRERKQEADQAEFRRKFGLDQNSYNENMNNGEEDEASKSRQFFSCPACPLVFDTENLLDDHILTHPACMYCEKPYKLLDSLRRHVKRSHPEEYAKKLPVVSFFPHQVDDTTQEGDQNAVSLSGDSSEQVNSDFVDGSAQSVHGTATGVPVGVVFPCTATSCSVIFNSKEALAAHMTTHYSCVHCGKVYSIKRSLIKHIQRTHPVQYVADKAQCDDDEDGGVATEWKHPMPGDVDNANEVTVKTEYMEYEDFEFPNGIQNPNVRVEV